MRKKNVWMDMEMPNISGSLQMPNLFEEPRPRPLPRPYPYPRPRVVYGQRPRVVYVPRGYARPRVRYARQSQQRPMLTTEDKARMWSATKTGAKYTVQGAKIAASGIKTGISFVRGKLPKKTYGNQPKKFAFEEK